MAEFTEDTAKGYLRAWLAKRNLTFVRYVEIGELDYHRWVVVSRHITVELSGWGQRGYWVAENGNVAPDP